jgi:hypothetical protein
MVFNFTINGVTLLGKSGAGVPRWTCAGGKWCRRTTLPPRRRWWRTAGAPAKKLRLGLARSTFSRIGLILPAHPRPGAPAVTWAVISAQQPLPPLLPLHSSTQPDPSPNPPIFCPFLSQI